MRSQRASSQAALRDESAGLLSRDLEKLSRLGCLPIVTKRTEVEELKANRNENENESEEERRGEVGGECECKCMVGATTLVARLELWKP